MTEHTLASLQFEEAEQAIKANVEAGDMTPTLVLGRPGCGKTALFTKVAVDYGIPLEVAQRCIFRPSLRDPTDLLGLPHTERGEDGQLYTHWSINSFISYVNEVARKYGIAFLIIDEAPQAVQMMQNAIAGLVYDRFVGDNWLEDRVFIGLTGNGVKDKAGAGRILTQLGNRCEVWEMAPDLDAWAAHMLAKGVDPMLVAYARFDPGCLDDFNPDRTVNGSMRSMEAAAKINPDLPENIYMAKLAGRIPESRAAQYIAFRRLYDELPTAEEMTTKPREAKLPTDNRGALFAAAGLAFKRVDHKTWPALCIYMERVATQAYAPDIEAAFYKDVVAHKPEFVSTKEFSAWATTRGADVTLH